jgi:hypothetical protein
MIFPARIYNPQGELKRVVSVEEQSTSHWKRFTIRKDLKFGEKTEVQKYLAMQRMCDEFVNTYWEFEE